MYGITPTQLTNISTSLDQGLERRVDSHANAAALLSDIATVVWQAVPPLLLVLGLGGNVMTIVVMRRLGTSDSSACIALYFSALACSDLVLLVSSISWNWTRIYAPELNAYDLVCTIPFFLSYVSSLTSAWILVVMTYQRVTSVVLPHRVGVLCTAKRGKIMISVILIVACALNVHIFVNYHTEDVGDRYVCQSIDDYLANVFLLFDLVMASVLPSLSLLIGNTVLIRRVVDSARFSMKRPSQRSDTSRSSQVTSVTFTLILTSSAFCLLTLPTCIVDLYLEEVGFYEGEVDNDDEHAKLTLLETVSLMLWISNSAVNFYIYILSGSKFREEVKRRLCLRCLQAPTTGGTQTLKH